MRRYDYLQRLAGMVSERTLVVCNLQDTTYEWQHLRQGDGNLLRMGMACVTPVAFGLATSLPREKVVALDGDGSLLLGLGMLTTLGRYPTPNLVVLVFDNQCYYSTTRATSLEEAQLSATAFGTDLEAMARGAGVRDAVTVRDMAGFEREVGAALAGDRMAFIVVKVDDIQPVKVPMPTTDGKENKYRFMRFIERLVGGSFLPTEEEKVWKTPGAGR